MVSAIANTFVVSLQMVRKGELEMQQEGTFEPIFLRSTEELFETAQKMYAEKSKPKCAIL